MRHLSVVPAAVEKRSAATVSTSKDRLWFSPIDGEVLSVLVRSDAVSGRCTILESVAAPGTGTPMHVHKEDEIFQIVEGVLTFSCEGEVFDAIPGTTVVIPAGAQHAWKNRSSEPVRTFVTITPGGLESMFEKLSTASPEEFVALAASYGSFIVGPPID